MNFYVFFALESCAALIGDVSVSLNYVVTGYRKNKILLDFFESRGKYLRRKVHTQFSHNYLAAQDWPLQKRQENKINKN